MILHVLVSVLISIFYEISVLENFFLCVCVGINSIVIRGKGGENQEVRECQLNYETREISFSTIDIGRK